MIKHLQDQVKRSNTYHHRDPQSPKSARKCKKCDLVFDTSKLLIDHMKVHHSNDIKYRDCGSCFDQQWKLEKHLGQEHSKEKVYNCEHCGESFFNNWRLKKHSRSHDEANSATITIISRSVPTKS